MSRLPARAEERHKAQLRRFAGTAGGVIEQSFGRTSRFRRSARDYERLLETQAVLHFLPFVILMLKNVAGVLV